MSSFLLIAQGGTQQLLLFAVIGVLFYMMLIRPQQKQRRVHQAMLAAVKTGDKIMTVGGIIGLVTNVKDDSVTVKIADNVKVEVFRSHISKVLARGSEDSENNGSSSQ